MSCRHRCEPFERFNTKVGHAGERVMDAMLWNHIGIWFAIGLGITMTAYFTIEHTTCTDTGLLARHGMPYVGLSMVASGQDICEELPPSFANLVRHMDDEHLMQVISHDYTMSESRTLSVFEDWRAAYGGPP